MPRPARGIGWSSGARRPSTGPPFDAPYLGVVVRDGGLATACQADLPPVQGGRFEVGVYAEAESAGCGRPGAEIVLWTYAGDQRLFSSCGGALA